MGFDLPVMNRLRRSGQALSPASLFATGAQGVIYDPRDLSTMFQDSTGTTPVTAPGQVVGLRLDKSKGLALGAELVANGDFSGGTTGWTAQAGTTLSVAAGVASVGGASPSYAGQSFTTVVGRTYKATATLKASPSLVSFGGIRKADTLTAGGTAVSIITSNTATFADQTSTVYFSATSTTTWIVIQANSFGTVNADNISVRELAGNHAVQATAGARLTYGIEPKTGTRNLLLATDTLATQSLTVAAVPHTLAFTGTGTVTLSGASTAGPLVGTGAGNRVTLTFTPTAASLTLTVSGSVTLGQLQLGSTDTPYQKVVTAFEVTEAGVPTCHYCAYAGANSMATAAIDFTATDKMSVFAGVWKRTDFTTESNAQHILETSADASVNNGAFILNASIGYSLGIKFGFQTKASGSNGGVDTTSTAFSAPVAVIATGIGDISGDTRTLRLNGTQIAQNTSDQGAGNYGNYPLFIGRRNNATLPFNGRDYGIVIVGKATSAAEINITEAWLAANTPTVVL